MKKVIKSRIFLVIITMIICISGTLYAATTYKASDVIYNASDGTSMSVNDALNELYNKTGCSNIMSISQYFKMDTDFTYASNITNIKEDNIIIELASFSIPSSLTSTITFTKSVDENGNITISRNGTSGSISVIGMLFAYNDVEFVKNVTMQNSYTVTVDCTSIENYKELSEYNFLIDMRYVKLNGNSGTATFTKSYNASTGKLTFSRSQISGVNCANFNIDVYVRK